MREKSLIVSKLFKEKEKEKLIYKINISLRRLFFFLKIEEFIYLKKSIV
jgi:hypothetical protein